MQLLDLLQHCLATKLYLLFLLTVDLHTTLFDQFFASEERIKYMRKMIMAVTPEQRKAVLNMMLPFQRSDFAGIFRAMDGTILLLIGN